MSLPIPTSTVTVNNATYTVSELTLGALEEFMKQEAKAVEANDLEQYRTYRLSVIAWSLNRAQSLEGEAAYTANRLKTALGLTTLNVVYDHVLVISGLKTDKPTETGEASASQSS
jgi:hypothetical protein